MFSINSISLFNFKSFKGKAKLVLPTEPGLYYVTGENKYKPRLGANGIGKSTLLDAIHWCLYGTTLRGLKAANVITWGESTCAVTLKLTIGEDDCVVRRTQKPNKLTLQIGDAEENIVEQDALEKVLRLSSRAFTASVIAAQFGRSFLEMGATEKLTLFSKIKNLDYWVDLSNKAKARVTQAQIDLEKHKGVYSNNRSLIEHIQQSIKNYEASSSDFKNIRRTNIEKCLQGITHTEKEIAQAKDEIKIGEETLTALNERVEELTTIKQKKASIVDGLNTKYTLSIADEAKLKAELDNNKRLLRRTESMEGVCNTCGQEIDAAHKKAELKKLTVLCGKLTDSYEKQADDTNSLKRELTRAKKDYEDSVMDLARDERLAVKYKIKISDLKHEERTLKSKRDEMLKQMEKIKNEGNPFEKLIAGAEDNLNKAEQNKQELKKKITKAETLYEALSYWAKAFLQLRLFIIEDTLRSLEIEVNNSLTTLGLDDFEITFDVERENKAGNITKGFIAMVHGPDNAEPVPFEAWSGGEAQRLQLAADLGLANLIMTEAGLVNTVEFYDEPSAHLSDEGLLDLAETLNQRALNEGKCIFLIDHRVIDYGDFAGQIQIVKGADRISSIVG